MQSRKSYLSLSDTTRTKRASPSHLKRRCLQNRAKVLIYLVALQGWPFVSAEAIPIDAKPAELSEETGVPGGTLRPILKELKDRHVIAERNGRYFIRPVSLSSIKTELFGDGDKIIAEKTRRQRPQAPKEAIGNVKGPLTSEKKASRKVTVKKTGGLGARFNKWIDDGYFSEPKTLGEVQKRFQKEGVIVPQSTISPYLLNSVRAGRLTREETLSNKKHLWVYRSDS